MNPQRLCRDFSIFQLIVLVLRLTNSRQLFSANSSERHIEHRPPSTDQRAVSERRTGEQSGAFSRLRARCFPQELLETNSQQIKWKEKKKTHNVFSSLSDSPALLQHPAAGPSPGPGSAEGVTAHKYTLSIFKNSWTASVTQTGGNNAFVGDYFWQRINTFICL